VSKRIKNPLCLSEISLHGHKYTVIGWSSMYFGRQLLLQYENNLKKLFWFCSFRGWKSLSSAARREAETCMAGSLEVEVAVDGEASAAVAVEAEAVATGLGITIASVDTVEVTNSAVTASVAIASAVIVSATTGLVSAAASAVSVSMEEGSLAGAAQGVSTTGAGGAALPRVTASAAAPSAAPTGDHLFVCIIQECVSLASFALE
jgi:hypothetical protein